MLLNNVINISATKQDNCKEMGLDKLGPHKFIIKTRIILNFYGQVHHLYVEFLKSSLIASTVLIKESKKNDKIEVEGRSNHFLPSFPPSTFSFTFAIKFSLIECIINPSMNR